MFGVVLWGGPLPELSWIGVGALMVAAISFLDERIGVRSLYRLIVHFFAVAVCLSGGLWLVRVELPGVSWVLSEPISIVLSLLFATWMLNLYNFMDGMDGFAGGMSVIGFGSLAMFAGLEGEYGFMGTSLVIASAAGGFLLFNFPPARIFMGDVGSSFLGLLAAALLLWGDRDDIFPLWIGVLVFSPFIVDATATLFLRMFRGERIWEAHRHHFYQRLVQLGWGHRRTVIGEYALMLACSISAWVAMTLTPGTQWLILIAWATAYVLLMQMVYRLEAGRGRVFEP
jgi:UDP-N-acetylmuramyl pentapeptide phosphotransferase/UDP-N-acetylglucosamine-1-phosphate transferase